jgi:hypothetical protein
LLAGILPSVSAGSENGGFVDETIHSSGILSVVHLADGRRWELESLVISSDGWGHDEVGGVSVIVIGSEIVSDFVSDDNGHESESWNDGSGNSRASSTSAGVSDVSKSDGSVPFGLSESVSETFVWWALVSSSGLDGFQEFSGISGDVFVGIGVLVSEDSSWSNLKSSETLRSVDGFHIGHDIDHMFDGVVDFGLESSKESGIGNQRDDASGWCLSQGIHVSKMLQHGGNGAVGVLFETVGFRGTTFVGIPIVDIGPFVDDHGLLVISVKRRGLDLPVVFLTDENSVKGLGLFVQTEAQDSVIGSHLCISSVIDTGIKVQWLELSFTWSIFENCFVCKESVVSFQI